MKFPRRRPPPNEDASLQKALGAVAAAFLAEDNLRKGFLNGNAAVMPGSSWSNQGTINSRLIGRVTQNLGQSFGRAPEELELALAEQGLSWGPPFPPGRPLDPFWGYRRPPRTWDYAIGENVQLTPRWDRISFPTLKAIINAYYAAQICIRHLINDVRCHSDDTEILTERGWQLFAKLDRDVSVATRNTQGEFEWQMPTDYIEVPYSGRMVGFTSRTMDALVTPNHRMLTVRPPNCAQPRPPERIRLASEIVGKKGYCAPAHSNWVGQSPSTFTVPAVTLSRGGTAKRREWPSFHPGVTLPAEDWCAFLGIWLAEGSVRGSKGGRGPLERKGSACPFSVTVSQSKESPHYHEIQRLLDRLPWHFIHSGDSWICQDVALWTYLRPLGNSSTKYVPSEVRGFAPALLEVLLEWAIKGDGHETLRPDGSVRRCITTVSEELAGNWQEVIQKCGREASVSTSAPRRYAIDGRTGWGQTTYTVLERYADQHQLRGRYASYSGVVYCVAVPNGVIYTRRNGKPLWAGNSLDYQFVPPLNVQEDATEDLERCEAFFRYPDRRQPFRAWLAEYLQDVLRFDAGTLYVRRNEKDEPIALEVVSGATIIPLLDFFGRVAMDEEDASLLVSQLGGEWDGKVTPAYLQIIEGLPWDWLAADDIIYQPWNPLPDSQFGLAPMEAVLMQANVDIRFQWHFLQYFCYDDQTEVLTSQGWRFFSDLDGAEQYATRSPEGAFEWQASKDQMVHRFDYDGDLVCFKNQCVDQMVTPNHRMLVRRIPDKPGETATTRFHDWHIRAAEYFVGHPTAEFQLPVTSSWEGVAPSESPCGMTPSAWARFLGIYIAEGWRRHQTPAYPGRWEVTVSQFPGGDLDEVHRILKDTGLNWRYDAQRGRFTVGCKALWLALEGTGSKAPEKVLPAEVLGWSVPLIEDVLHGLMAGDGHVVPSGQRVYTTTSKVLAGQVQELWQKAGVYAAVWRSEPDPRTMAKLPQYRVRTRPEEAFRVPRPSLVPYRGQVSCVSVPNGIILTRRNGKIVWSGNTEGSLPAGFMEAPPDLSDPVQIVEWQETWDAFMLGDQSKLRQIRWVPQGSKFTPVKNSDFNDAFPLYLMRCTAAAFGVVPNDLGFTENVNRSTGDTQIDVQFRVGTLPLVRHVEDLLNAFIAEHLKLKARLQFDVGREVEDRLATAQAEQIYINCGVLSPDEPRMRLGKRISRDRPTPRLFNNTRSGPIPLLSVESLSGKIDPTTFGPAKDQQLVDHPFFAAPGVSPVLESDDYRASRNTTAEMQANMLIQNDHPKAPRAARRGDGSVQTEPSVEKALEDALSVIDSLLALKDGVDNTGGPGVTRGFSNPTTITGGISVDTDLQGVDLDEEETKKALRQWRENSLNRVRKGLAPRRFADIPSPLADLVWGPLESARTPEEVKAAFTDVGKALALSGAVR